MKSQKTTTLSMMAVILLLTTAMVSSAAARSIDIHPSLVQDSAILGEDTNSFAMDGAEKRLSRIDSRYLKKNRQLSVDEVKKARVILEKARYRLTGTGIKPMMARYCDQSCHRRDRYRKLMVRFNQIEDRLIGRERGHNLEFVSVQAKKPLYKAFNK